MVTKTLIQIGDSVGLIFDKPLLQSLELRKGDEVGVELRDGALVVSRLRKKGAPKGPANRSRSARMAAIREELHANLGPAFRKLAK
jgi:antitoxin component of MazEF toxin-antitoxin module